jgi:hypothetical protein
MSGKSRGRLKGWWAKHVVGNGVLYRVSTINHCTAHYKQTYKILIPTSRFLHHEQCVKVCLVFQVFHFLSGVVMPESMVKIICGSGNWVLVCVREPKASCCTWPTGFDQICESMFFQHLKTLMSKHSFTSIRTCDLDEDGNSTVHVPSNSICSEGLECVSSVTSEETGINVTMFLQRCSSQNCMLTADPTISVGDYPQQIGQMRVCLLTARSSLLHVEGVLRKIQFCWC